MLYSKNGSIPKPETDGTDGWIEVNNPPAADDGFEVVWWFPPGWVVRPIKPADEEGFVWSWTQSEEQWTKIALFPQDASSLEASELADNANGSIQVEFLTPDVPLPDTNMK